MAEAAVDLLFTLGVAPGDALIVINDLNANGSRNLYAPLAIPEYFFDTTGDDHIELMDALLVINRLNEPTGGEVLDVEGEDEFARRLASNLTALGGERASRFSVAEHDLALLGILGDIRGHSWLDGDVEPNGSAWLSRVCAVLSRTTVQDWVDV